LLLPLSPAEEDAGEEDEEGGVAETLEEEGVVFKVGEVSPKMSSKSLLDAELEVAAAATALSMSLNMESNSMLNEGALTGGRPPSPSPPPPDMPSSEDAGAAVEVVDASPKMSSSGFATGDFAGDTSPKMSSKSDILY